MATKSKRRLLRIRRTTKGTTKHSHAANQRARTKSHPPRTANQFFAMPERLQDRWNHVAHAISKMRANHLSLKQASEEFGLDPRTTLRLAKSALRKKKSGQYVAKPADRLLRVLVLPTEKGLREVAVRDSREASRVGEYWAGIQKYLATGDASGLKKIRRKTVTDASRKRIRLLTNLEKLDEQASAGVLSFESMYGGVA